jgi:O-antigen ligase
LVFKTFNLDQFRRFTNGFTILMLCSLCYVVYNYFHNFELILNEMLQGHPIPVPFQSHIRYSILLNIALMVSLHRANLLSVNRKKIEYIIWVVIVFILFVFLQFLAVKVGMVISYIVIICFTVHKIFQTREFILGAILLTSFCMVSVIAMSKLPTIKNKMAYVKYDLKRYEMNDTKNYSDGERIVSVKKGIDVIIEHPWLGVGEGNIAKYLTTNENGEIKLPHNQFILTWSQNGILGFFLLITCFIYSILSSIRRKNWLLFTITISYFVACMVESMLETQIGAAVFILPWVLFASLTNVHEK